MDNKMPGRFLTQKGKFEKCSYNSLSMEVTPSIEKKFCIKKGFYWNPNSGYIIALKDL
ncbi:Uncharacterised protein [Mycobacteroides abscessus subsp. abscessus]|nr:Uncharacterised protein [Mycobacteroides abscessus subsp. abscessus]